MSRFATLAAYAGDDESFVADQFFLGLAQRAAAGTAITRISLDAVGEVVIEPTRRLYTAFMPHPEAFCRAATADFRILASEVASVGNHGTPRDLAELLWIAAHHAAAGRLLAGCSKYDVVRLRHWPNLARLPAGPGTLRLCAFLSRRPSAIHLARKLVGTDEGEAYGFYSAALCAGVLEVVSRAPAQGPTEPDPAPEHGATIAAPSSDRSVLRLLWNKVARL